MWVGYPLIWNTIDISFGIDKFVTIQMLPKMIILSLLLNLVLSGKARGSSGFGGGL